MDEKKGNPKRIPTGTFTNNIIWIVHSWQGGSFPPPLFYEDRPYIAYPPPFFSNFVQPSPFPVASNRSSCCLASLAERVITPHLMCYFI